MITRIYSVVRGSKNSCGSGSVFVTEHLTDSPHCAAIGAHASGSVMATAPASTGILVDGFHVPLLDRWGRLVRGVVRPRRRRRAGTAGYRDHGEFLNRRPLMVPPQGPHASIALLETTYQRHPSSDAGHPVSRRNVIGRRGCVG